jgi:hypothetical protein
MFEAKSGIVSNNSITNFAIRCPPKLSKKSQKQNKRKNLKESEISHPMDMTKNRKGLNNGTHIERKRNNIFRKFYKTTKENSVTQSKHKNLTNSISHSPNV